MPGGPRPSRVRRTAGPFSGRSDTRGRVGRGAAWPAGYTDACRPSARYLPSVLPSALCGERERPPPGCVRALAGVLRNGTASVLVWIAQVICRRHTHTHARARARERERESEREREREASNRSRDVGKASRCSGRTEFAFSSRAAFTHHQYLARRPALSACSSAWPRPAPFSWCRRRCRTCPSSCPSATRPGPSPCHRRSAWVAWR